jgi:hypothetical protein
VGPAYPSAITRLYPRTHRPPLRHQLDPPVITMPSPAVTTRAPPPARSIPRTKRLLRLRSVFGYRTLCSLRSFVRSPSSAPPWRSPHSRPGAARGAVDGVTRGGFRDSAAARNAQVSGVEAPSSGPPGPRCGHASGVLERREGIRVGRVAAVAQSCAVPRALTASPCPTTHQHETSPPHRQGEG